MEDFEAHRAGRIAATYRVLMGELDKYAPGVQDEPERVSTTIWMNLPNSLSEKDHEFRRTHGLGRGKRRPRQYRQR